MEKRREFYRFLTIDMTFSARFSASLKVFPSA
jgi:hypothetical protein